MELPEILEIMKSPEKIVDPRQANVMSGYLGGFITDLEEQLNEQNYEVSVEWGRLHKQEGTIAAADRAIELTDLYRKREKTKLLIGQLRRFRQDLRDRFEVLTKYQ